MSLYTLAAASLTTSRDRNRHPAANRGQIARTLLLTLVLALVALVLLHRQGHAAQGAGFHGFVEGLWPQAHRRGVNRDTFERAFAGVTPDPAVLARTHRQAEFATPLRAYLAAAASRERVETGRERARAFKDVLKRADARFGVDPYVVLGVWGLESNFGNNTGNLGTIRCLATLAYARYRGDYFRRELLDALDILQQGHVDVAAMRGSWAGAMGQTQFMPSAFKRYAIDFAGHGRKDIWGSVPDALGSTAFFLRRHGWRPGEAWGYEVAGGGGVAGQAWGQARGQARGQAKGDGKAMRPFASWAAAGLRRADGGALPRTGVAALLTPAGPGGPRFLVTRNFGVIKRYNNSTAYALGVALLGDRIAGAAPLHGSWPVAAR